MREIFLQIVTHAGRKSAIHSCTRRQPYSPRGPLDFLSFTGVMPNAKMHSRDAVFDECMYLLHSVEKSWNKAHLPVLQGSYAGYAVALSVVEDTIGWGKVPPLWLLVKVECNRPSRGSLAFIVWPANNEFYSPSWQWDGTLAVPASWPQQAIVKYHEQPADVG